MCWELTALMSWDICIHEQDLFAVFSSPFLLMNKKNKSILWLFGIVKHACFPAENKIKSNKCNYYPR